MTCSPAEAWTQCLVALKEKLFSQSYDTWIKPLVCTRFDSELVVLEAPYSFSVSWIREHYLTDIERTIRKLFNISPRVEFELLPGSSDEETRLLSSDPPVPTGPGVLDRLAATSKKPTPPRDKEPAGTETLSLVNKDYTFGSFVIGSNNEVAQSAAKTVARNPGRTPFNPLLIYGGVGLGKTHLLHAVANECALAGNAKNVIYLTSEQFVREFVTSLKENRTLQFARRYRQADVMLVDDIQFFQGKERMQEEFFHTFNTLHGQGKQIVLSSDRPPEALGGLQDRLLSRFQWGLVADIQPPDLETKIAICEMKAEATGLHLDDSAAEFIASQVKSNIRELEGIIKRLLFLVQNHDAKLTLDIVESAVRTMRLAAPETVTVKRIQEAVASRYGISVDLLTGKSRRSDVVSKRQLAMYLCKLLTTESLRAIGAAFGGRDHATVIHACERIEAALAEQRSLVLELNSISVALGVSGRIRTNVA
ncbi:MAG: Chromosomal replication initiator protein DnaA [Candidatus Latescibacteria bacterium ADurb.Bin168]|nr:MAG: Chromosomal replication initiator protein DnaA [Candidatus Latescibacteria bacterium ADurb.Bin168]